jgi:hypothetical protein
MRLKTMPLLWMSITTFGVIAEVTNGQDQFPPVSRYAPAEILGQQIHSYLDSLTKDLASDDYGADQKGRVQKDAATVSVLALMLGRHDQDNPHKKAAQAVIDAANRLSSEAADQTRAKGMLASLKKAVESPSVGEEVAWKPSADLAQLMKQVPIVNNSLRRGVTSRRFTRSLEKTAGDAVTLAAIAQASLVDTNYCSDEEGEKEWQRICAEMRDACAVVLDAVQNKDQAKATAALEKIVQSCDACHHKFRD